MEEVPGASLGHENRFRPSLCCTSSRGRARETANYDRYTEPQGPASLAGVDTARSDRGGGVVSAVDLSRRAFVSRTARSTSSTDAIQARLASQGRRPSNGKLRAGALDEVDRLVRWPSSAMSWAGRRPGPAPLPGRSAHTAPSLPRHPVATAVTGSPDALMWLARCRGGTRTPAPLDLLLCSGHRALTPRTSRSNREPFPSSVDRVLDVVQNQDGLHHRGRPARTTAQLDQDFQVLRMATARSPRARTRAWDLFTAFCRRDSLGR